MGRIENSPSGAMRDLQRDVCSGVQWVPGYATTTPDLTLTGVLGNVRITETFFPESISYCQI